MTVTQAEHLEPCPFCGCPAEFEHLEDGRWSVGCVEGDHDLCIGYQTLTTFSRQTEAAAAWNKRAKHREDAERPLLERIEALEAALTLAANRLHRRAVDFGTGTGLFFETCDWAAEARQALGETQ
ncbi:MAG: Lar family restriction alleviation protein [Gallionella sp.]|nr:Lar family restriction alleviation protein [Gallionella sp.]